MKKKIFITGGTGFIGNNLIKRLINDNEIYVLCRTPNEHIDKRVNIIIGDILKPQSFVNSIKGINLLFHCAANISFKKNEFEEVYQTNVCGTKNILESSLQAGVEKVVHLSAGAVLGYRKDIGKLIDENCVPYIKKENVYAYTKKLAEEEVQKYVKKGLNVSIANIATVYGVGDNRLNSGAIIKSIYDGNINFVPPGGTSFVAIDDLITGLLLTAERGKAGERYIFCSENMQYRVLTKRIASVLKVAPPKYVLPNLFYWPALCGVKCLELLESLLQRKQSLINVQVLKESFGYKYFNSNKAKEQLGWIPTQSFEETVKSAFDYYKTQHIF